MGMISLLIYCVFFLNPSLDAARSLSSEQDKRRSVMASPHTRQLMCATWKSARISNGIHDHREYSNLYILDSMCGVPSGTGKQWHSVVGRMGHCPIPSAFVEYMDRPVIC